MLRWEHFPHGADIGVRGFGPTKAEAFEQAALATTAVVADPATVAAREAVTIACEAPDDELLLANRQILTHLVRQVFSDLLPAARLPLLYDVSHNTSKVEQHRGDGGIRRLYVHRKGATRAFGPGHPDLPDALRAAGQPVLIGGSMGTGSYVLAGTRESEALAFSSACHGAGRALSRHQAARNWHGRQVIDELAARGILIRSSSWRGVAEEAPGAYKDVSAVVDAADAAGLARKVARLEPLICVKG